MQATKRRSSKTANERRSMYGFEELCDDPATRAKRRRTQSALLSNKLVPNPTAKQMISHQKQFNNRWITTEEAGNKCTIADGCAFFLDTLPMNDPEFAAAYDAFRLLGGKHGEENAPTWSECMHIYKTMIDMRPPPFPQPKTCPKPKAPVRRGFALDVKPVVILLSTVLPPRRSSRVGRGARRTTGKIRIRGKRLDTRMGWETSTILVLELANPSRTTWRVDSTVFGSRLRHHLRAQESGNGYEYGL
ncbi:hypothetical protein IAR50_006983 [Cryptococcus sp. DSM 104548]